MAGDAISSLAVVVAGIILHYTHWLYADPLPKFIIFSRKSQIRPNKIGGSRTQIRKFCSGGKLPEIILRNLDFN